MIREYTEPFGDEVGPGWMPVVIDADAKLKYLDPDYRISQIKEKFGGLRYYFQNSEDASTMVREICDAVVRMAEVKCDRLCEECGEPGKLRDGSWYKTLCDEDWKIWETRHDRT